MIRAAVVWVSLTLVALAGCDPLSATQLDIQIDSDLDPGTQLVSVRLQVQRDGESAPILDRTYSLTTAPMFNLPGDVVVTANPNDPHRVVVILTGNLVDGSTVTQQAIVTLVAGRRTVLAMALLASCENVHCAAEQSCGPTGCEAEVHIGNDMDGSTCPNDETPCNTACCSPGQVCFQGACVLVNDECPGALLVSLDSDTNVTTTTGDVFFASDSLQSCTPNADLFFEFVLTDQEYVSIDAAGSGPDAPRFRVGLLDGACLPSGMFPGPDASAGVDCGGTCNGIGEVSRILGPGTYHVVVDIDSGLGGNNTAFALEIHHVPVNTPFDAGVCD